MATGMRVAFLSHTSTVSGGEHSLLSLLAALPAGVDPTVVCPRGDLADRVDALGIPVTRCHGTAGSLKLHPVHTTRAIGELALAALAVRRHASRVHADVVHANSIRAGLIAAAAARLGAPSPVVHVRDCLPHSAAADLVRSVITHEASAVVAISQHVANNFVADDARRVHVIDNPVDLDRFDPDEISRAEARAQLALDPDIPLLGLVGQITPWKGQDDAIRALMAVRSRYPRAHLLLVGEPKFVDRATRFDNRSYLASLHALIDDLGLREAVTFLGERRDVPAVMRALDVLLLPSVEEPFGRSLIEAMAMGTTVVATDVGGPAEIVVDGINGLLAPPRDPERWAHAVIELLDDPGRRERLAAAGRATALERFDHRRHAAAISAVYETATTDVRS